VKTVLGKITTGTGKLSTISPSCKPTAAVEKFIVGGAMKKSELTLPEIGLIAGTRVMLGAGAGLLLADRLNDDQRKKIGWTLLIIGAVSTIPLMIDVLGKRK
jgi:hypothetical protein